MTPALKAMVEAMVAEAERQTDAVFRDDDGKTLCLSVEGGSLDLEKVARAGLAAIPKAALASGVAAAFYEVGGTADDGGWEVPSPDAALEAMLDAILKADGD